MAERTGLFQLPRDPEKAVQILAGKPIDQLLGPGITTDNMGRIILDADFLGEQQYLAELFLAYHLQVDSLLGG